MAAGDTLCVFFPQDNEPPSADYATLDVRNGTLVLSFDSSNSEYAIFAGFMPRNYAGGGVTVTIGWMAEDTTVTPHNAVWRAAFASVTNDADDLDSDLYGDFNSTGAVEEASASGEVAYDTIAFTDGADMDSVAAGEYFRLKIERDAEDVSATDSLTGNAQLVFVEVRETPA